MSKENSQFFVFSVVKFCTCAEQAWKLVKLSTSALKGGENPHTSNDWYSYIPSSPLRWTLSKAHQMLTGYNWVLRHQLFREDFAPIGTNWCVIVSNVYIPEFFLMWWMGTPLAQTKKLEANYENLFMSWFVSILLVKCYTTHQDKAAMWPILYKNICDLNTMCTETFSCTAWSLSKSLYVETYSLWSPLYGTLCCWKSTLSGEVGAAQIIVHNKSLTAFMQLSHTFAPLKAFHAGKL